MEKGGITENGGNRGVGIEDRGSKGFRIGSKGFQEIFGRNWVSSESRAEGTFAEEG